MSYIPCVNHCVYQHEGICRLEQSASCGPPTQDSDCLYCVPKATAQNTKNTTTTRPYTNLY